LQEPLKNLENFPQEVSEAYLIGLFEDTNLSTLHSKQRYSARPKNSWAIKFKDIIRAKDVTEDIGDKEIDDDDSEIDTFDDVIDPEEGLFDDEKDIILTYCPTNQRIMISRKRLLIWVFLLNPYHSNYKSSSPFRAIPSICFRGP